MKPDSSSFSEEDEARSVIGSDDESGVNDAHVEIESDRESDAHESSSSCLDESSDEGNTRKKKLLQRSKGRSNMRILHKTST